MGPIFLLWKIWLECNRRIFCGETRLLGMIQETVEAKCEVELPLGKPDTELVERLGTLRSSLALTRAKRRRHEKQKIDRVGRWQPPSYGVLKINTDGSSRGNLGPSGIGGIGRDAMGRMIFIFLIYDGIQTINLVEGLVILAALEKAHALGWRRIICEFDS